MKISELISKHPEVKINLKSPLLEDQLNGTLFIKTDNKLQQLTVKNCASSLKKIQDIEDTANLRRVRDLTMLENMGD